MSPTASSFPFRSPTKRKRKAGSEIIADSWKVGCLSMYKNNKNVSRKLLSSHKVSSISSVSDVYGRNLATFLKNGIVFPLLFVFIAIYCIDSTECASQVSPSTVNGLGKPISSASTSRADGKDGRGNADDNESSSNHHHHHSYHRHRHGSSSGKNSPHSSSSSSSSSIYPSSSAYGYPDYYSPDSFYEPRYYERPSREFSARSTTYPAMASAASSQVGFADTEYGGLALATGHGGGHGGHGHAHGHGHGHDGGGYGHGHHTTYYKTVNKLDQSSLGLLGLLGLLSLLSNVLMLLTTTARASSMAPAPAAGGLVDLRIKRDTMMFVKVKDNQEEEHRGRRSVVERLSRLILPSLVTFHSNQNIVGHAKDGRIPINCTYQEVCKTNRVLIEIFGADGGRPVGSVLSTAIAKLLSDNNSKKDHHYHHRASIKVKSHHERVPGTDEPALVLIEKLLQQAGLAGRNGEDCEIAYPTCAALLSGSSEDDEKDYSSVNDIKKKRAGQVQLPMLISPEHALAIILGQSHG